MDGMRAYVRRCAHGSVPPARTRYVGYRYMVGVRNQYFISIRAEGMRANKNLWLPLPTEARQARGLSNFTIHVNKYKFSEVIFEFENPGPVTTRIIITTMPITKQQSTTVYCHRITDLNL